MSISLLSNAPIPSPIIRIIIHVPADALKLPKNGYAPYMDMVNFNTVFFVHLERNARYDLG